MNTSCADDADREAAAPALEASAKGPPSGCLTLFLPSALAGRVGSVEARARLGIEDVHLGRRGTKLMATGAAILVTVSAIVDEAIVIPERRATWLALAYLVGVGSGVVFVLYAFVIRVWNASRAAYGFVITPVVTVFVSVWLDDETITGGLVVGGALVLAGVYFGALRPAEDARAETEAVPSAYVTPVCATCGAVYPEADEAPAECPICEDERQWVPESGQKWTSLEELAGDHRNEIRKEDSELFGIGIEPEFALGQRMLLLESPAGNVLWDMIPLCTDDAVAEVRQRGGAAAIAISHPHYYSGMLEWSSALGDVPILLHVADREWVTRPDPSIEYWDGETYELTGGLTLLRLDGHFAGGTVLHWPDGADGRGTLLSGDIVQVLPHRRSVTFMWSYPNMLPLPASEVRRMVAALEEWEFDRIWGAWWGRVIRSDAKAVVGDSAERYVRASGR